MNEIINIPLMENNITIDDRNILIDFLKRDEILTQSTNVRAFEEEWSKWLGVKYSVFVNSGASANLITMAAIKHLYGEGEIIVPPLTWVSDIASVLQNNHTPVFTDIDRSSLAMDTDQILNKISPHTKAVFLTHILGFNGLTQKLLDGLHEKGVKLIEDVCESHGASFKQKKLGSYGFASNFSFYYAHHMSTIEGGMVCTNDDKFYEVIRMLRSHGMVREVLNEKIKAKYKKEYPDLNPDFIFSYPAYNVRSTEINAVLGRNQLKRLDSNNTLRIQNLNLFLKSLDNKKYQTDFNVEGAVSYAFTLVLNKPNDILRDNVQMALTNAKVEFRRGASGGGNQLRQPYLRHLLQKNEHKKYPITEHVHFYGFYIGNYPGLEPFKILMLCELLNSLPEDRLI